jgi:hypothetical protein
MSLEGKPAAASSSPDSRLAAILVGCGFALSVLIALERPEGFLQADDVTHFLYAKWAWTWPSYLLDDWGRPGFTALYFLPAKLGLTACRILSAALMASAVWAAYRIALLMGIRYAWAVVPLAFAQPMLLKLSQTTLTETPAAFYLTWAVYLAMRNRWAMSCMVLSPMFVTRHEAIIFVPIWIVAAWHGRRGKRFLPLLLWAPIAVHVGAYFADMPMPIARLFAPTSTSEYGRGGWLTFFCRSMEAWGPAISALAMTGIVHLVRSLRGGLPIVCVIVYFATQTILRALGLYGTGGYARFLVPIGPMVAICALAGWQWLRTQRSGAALTLACSMVILWLAMERQLILYHEQRDIAAEIPQLHLAVKTVRIATCVIALLTIAALLSRGLKANIFRTILAGGLMALIPLAMWGLGVRLQKPREFAFIADMQRWRQTSGLADRQVISASVMVDYAIDVALPPDRATVKARLRAAPVGALFAWETQFAPSPSHGLALGEMQSNPAYREIYVSPPISERGEPYLRLFEKMAHGVDDSDSIRGASAISPAS